MEIEHLYTLFQEHREICTDTRKITPGCIFFALKGEHFDGNRFAQDALDHGAAYAVVSNPSLVGASFLQTKDTLDTLQQLANFHRKQLSVPVLAITGSNGKTTTKEMITAALSTTFKVHATKGNFNNHIGVPLTLLAIPDDTEIVVCEMGANHQGEIKMLCQIAEPTHGIITNIGKAHLEGFGSLEGVKKGKGELFDFLFSHDGTAFINHDDFRLVEIAEPLKNKISYSLDERVKADRHMSYRPDSNGSGIVMHDEENDITIHSIW